MRFQALASPLYALSCALAFGSGCQNPAPPSAQSGAGPSPIASPAATPGPEPSPAAPAGTEPAPQSAMPSQVNNPLPRASGAPPALPHSTPVPAPSSAASGPPPTSEGRPGSAGAQHGLFFPPSTAGKFKVALAGCVAESTEASATRGAPNGDAGAAEPPPSGGESKVTVSTTGTGIIVAHDVAHACCLKAKVDVKVNGKTVQLTERLSGNACRCRCQSTIKTAVGLDPGDYKLKVSLAGEGATRVVHEQSVAIARRGQP